MDSTTNTNETTLVGYKAVSREHKEVMTRRVPLDAFYKEFPHLKRPTAALPDATAEN